LLSFLEIFHSMDVTDGARVLQHSCPQEQLTMRQTAKSFCCFFDDGNRALVVETGKKRVKHFHAHVIVYPFFCRANLNSSMPLACIASLGHLQASPFAERFLIIRNASSRTSCCIEKACSVIFLAAFPLSRTLHGSSVS